MTPFNLDIDMLRCFKKVAETGSFTQAGKSIGLTQSGVSIKIRRLEERLNRQVFNRTSKSLSLTHDGELLLDYAARILSVHDEAVNSLMQPWATGSLRVGLIDYFLPDLLPTILSMFRKQYPNVHLEVHSDVGIHLIPLYQKGDLDLVVTGKDAFAGKSRVLTQEPLIWVMGIDTEASQQEILPLALLPSPCSFRKIAQESLEKANRKWEILFTGSSISNIQAAVQAGIGLSILPRGALQKGLKKAPAHLGLPELPMYSIVVVTDEQQNNDARDVFVSYLETEINKLI